VHADFDGWRATIEMNVIGTLQVTKPVAAHMRGQGRGSIVFVSTSGIWQASAKQGAYNASKAALYVEVQVLAKELGPAGVRVNTVAPGWMMGPPVHGLFEMYAQQNGTTWQDEYDKVAADIPLRRIPTDEDCAGVIVFLASDLSAAVTGQCIDASGGQVMR
jgi:NAD(P)-dependent dehydrogenase (short-subunit alcohol dehydrogenase family)